MKRPISLRLFDKALAAALSAIEVYNKPVFGYRNELVAILMTNAWELLLKARIIQLNGNRADSIYCREPKTTASGKQSVRLYVKKNRTGNPMTIGVFAAIDALAQSGHALDVPCVTNLTLMIEIRDNAVHFHVADARLSQRIQEVGMAALANFRLLAEQWFGCDFTRYNFYLMPMSFYPVADVQVSPSSIPAQQKRLLAFLSREDLSPSPEGSCAVALRITARVHRGTAAEAVNVRYAPEDPHALPVRVDEENTYAGMLSFHELCARLKSRYSDFTMDAKFHRIKKELIATGKWSKLRPTNPKDKSKGGQMFYKIQIVEQFDPHYTKAVSAAVA